MEKFYLFNGIMIAYLSVYCFFCYKKYIKTDKDENRPEVHQFKKSNADIIGVLAKKAV
ncbi:MAG: hypothetical protein ACOY46_13575 [Bacillota bacterium]